MSLTNLRIWNRNKVKHFDRQDSNQASSIMPKELRASMISQCRVTNDNDRNRDLFWVIIMDNDILSNIARMKTETYL